jgi:hypothetical protein
VRRDLNICLFMKNHQSLFIFAKFGFTRSGPGLKCLKCLKLWIGLPETSFGNISEK